MGKKLYSGLITNNYILAFSRLHAFFWVGNSIKNANAARHDIMFGNANLVFFVCNCQNGL